jgi:hypothetical protein
MVNHSHLNFPIAFVRGEKKKNVFSTKGEDTFSISFKNIFLTKNAERSPRKTCLVNSEPLITFTI